MPSFICRSCGKEISYSFDEDDVAGLAGCKLPFVWSNTMVFDQWLMNQLGGECPSCYSIIAKQRYPRNILVKPSQKAVTIFSSMGQSLGDRVMQQVIKDRYVADNPDENVVFLDEMVGLEELRQYKPLKIFWANLFTGGQEWVPRDAFWFAVTNETTEFARQGHYSRLWFDNHVKRNHVEKIHEFSLHEFSLHEFSLHDFPHDWKRYVVVHLRNQIGIDRKDEKKNIRHEYAYLIFRLLQNRYKAGLIDGVVLVGNDSLANGYDIETIERFIDDSLPILDLRNRWAVEKIHESSLPHHESSLLHHESFLRQSADAGLKEIAWICKNAVMTIGRDSAIIQLAGAAGCPKLVAWDFVTENWFPKVKPGVLSAWLERESSVEKVLEAVKEGIG